MLALLSPVEFLFWNTTAKHFWAYALCCYCFTSSLLAHYSFVCLLSFPVSASYIFLDPTTFSFTFPPSLISPHFHALLCKVDHWPCFLLTAPTFWSHTLTNGAGQPSSDRSQPLQCHLSDGNCKSFGFQTGAFFSLTAKTWLSSNPFLNTEPWC